MANRSQNSMRTLYCRFVSVLLACITTLPQWTLHSHASSGCEPEGSAVHSLHLRIHHRGQENSIPADAVHLHCVPDALARALSAPSSDTVDFSAAFAIGTLIASVQDGDWIFCNGRGPVELSPIHGRNLSNASGRGLRTLHCAWTC